MVAGDSRAPEAGTQLVPATKRNARQVDLCGDISDVEGSPPRRPPRNPREKSAKEKKRANLDKANRGVDGKSKLSNNGKIICIAYNIGTCTLVAGKCPLNAAHVHQCSMCKLQGHGANQKEFCWKQKKTIAGTACCDQACDVSTMLGTEWKAAARVNDRQNEFRIPFPRLIW